MFGTVEEISGQVVETSQFEMKGDGVYYQFIKIAASDGAIYHVNNVIVPAQIDLDVQSGEDCVFYIYGFKNVATGFFRRNMIVASKGSRGVSLPKSRMFVVGLIQVVLCTALVSPFLYMLGLFTTQFLIGPIFGSTMVWIAAVWPIALMLHIGWTMLSVLIHINRMKVRLVGLSTRSQTLPNGQVVRTL
jgi:hypothetical protein